MCSTQEEKQLLIETNEIMNVSKDSRSWGVEWHLSNYKIVWLCCDINNSLFYIKSVSFSKEDLDHAWKDVPLELYSIYSTHPTKWNHFY